MITASFEFAAGVALFVGFIWFVHIITSPLDEFDENSSSIFGILVKFVIKYVVPYVVLFVIIFGLTNGSLIASLFFPGVIVKGFYGLLNQKNKKDAEAKSKSHLETKKIT